MNTLGFGLFVMLVGLSLMIWHWSQWNKLLKSSNDQRALRYGASEFRRRALIGSMMAVSGAILISLQWASNNPPVFTVSVLLLFLMLGGVLILATLDLLNVIVYSRLGPMSHEARARLIREYHERQKQQSGPKTEAGEEDNASEHAG
jgi:drug/metabolite transporter (DMT)-like permease